LYSQPAFLSTRFVKAGRIFLMERINEDNKKNKKISKVGGELSGGGGN
jgi:hypothetical protein